MTRITLILAVLLTLGVLALGAGVLVRGAARPDGRRASTKYATRIGQ